MAITPRLGIQTWDPNHTQANTIFNDAIDKYDVLIAGGAISRTTDAQPGSPSEGDVYIMTASATGADWASYSEHDLAYFRDAAWTAFAPVGRLGIFVDTPSPEYIVWNGAGWDVKLYDNTKYFGRNFQTGTSYELELSDAGKIIDMENASPNNVVIPAEASKDFPIDTRIDINQSGAGLTTVTITTDTLNGNPVCIGQWNGLSLWKRGSAEWVVWGGTT